MRWRDPKICSEQYSKRKNHKTVYSAYILHSFQQKKPKKILNRNVIFRVRIPLENVHLLTNVYSRASALLKTRCIIYIFGPNDRTDVNLITFFRFSPTPSRSVLYDLVISWMRDGHVSGTDNSVLACNVSITSARCGLRIDTLKTSATQNGLDNVGRIFTVLLIFSLIYNYISEPSSGRWYYLPKVYRQDNVTGILN